MILPLRMEFRRSCGIPGARISRPIIADELFARHLVLKQRSGIFEGATGND